MGFHKLILDFTNPAVGLVKYILGHTLKRKFSVTKSLLRKLEILLKISTGKSNGRIFWKNLENPNFGPFMLKYKSSSNIELHQFLQIKNALSHAKKITYMWRWDTPQNFVLVNFEKPEKSEFWKNGRKKKAEDITILRVCPKSHNHMKYSFGDM